MTLFTGFMIAAILCFIAVIGEIRELNRVQRIQLRREYLRLIELADGKSTAIADSVGIFKLMHPDIVEEIESPLVVE